MSPSITVPLWLVRNGSGHPRALVLAANSHDARTAVSGKKAWRTETVGFDTMRAGVTLPRVSVLFPILRVPAATSAGAGSAHTGAGCPVDMLTAAAATIGYTLAQVRYSRDPQACKVKSATWHVMVRLAGWSRAGTGRAFGFDHSTVINALVRADEFIAANDDAFTRAMAAAKASMSGASVAQAEPAAPC